MPTPKTSFLQSRVWRQSGNTRDCSCWRQRCRCCTLQRCIKTHGLPLHLPPTRSRRSLWGLHEILPLYSLVTDPTDALGPSYTSREEGDVGVCYPGLQSIRCGHGQWTRASSSLDSGRQEDRSRGTSAALKQPTQIYCTTANHHGSTRRDQDSRERSRIRDPSQTRGVPPPTNHPRSNRTSSVVGRLVPRRAPATDARAAGWPAPPGGARWKTISWTLSLTTPPSRRHRPPVLGCAADAPMRCGGAWRRSTSSTLHAKREAAQASTLC